MSSQISNSSYKLTSAQCSTEKNKSLSNDIPAILISETSNSNVLTSNNKQNMGRKKRLNYVLKQMVIFYKLCAYLIY